MQNMNADYPCELSDKSKFHARNRIHRDCKRMQQVIKRLHLRQDQIIPETWEYAENFVPLLSYTHTLLEEEQKWWETL